MRFFKYLIFILFSSVCSSAFAVNAYKISFQGISYSGETKEAVCEAYYNAVADKKLYKSWHLINNATACGFKNAFGTYSYDASITTYQAICPPKDYPAYFHQGPNGEIPTTRCMVVSGVNCKYVDRGEQPIWITMSGGSTPTRTLYSASINPDPYCADGDNGTCNRNDPYSGCYVPPNDNCLRQPDGSISCPDNQTPPISRTCNGATYCNRPPEGCGQGYVGGSFNGQSLCVSSGTGTGQPSTPPSTSTSNSSSTSTSTSSSTATGSGEGEGGTSVTNNNTTTNNTTNNTSVTIDVSGIINAINTLKNSMNPFLNEINTGVKSLNTTLTGTNQKLDTANTSLNNINQNVQGTNTKLDSTNTKLDSANTTLNSINQNGQTTNAKLQELINKPNGNGTGFSDTGIINAIEKQTTDIKDFFTPDESLKTDIESIGTASNDGRYLGSQNNASSSLQSLANAMTFSNAACVPDLIIDVPIYGSITIPLSKWCDILAIVKIFIQLAVLVLAFRMINDSVRSF